MTTPGHSHRLPRSLLVLVGICIMGLLASIILSFVYVQNVDARLGRLEQYIAGKGVARDAEQKRMEEQIRRSTCDLLDQLPEGGLLVKPRQKYHCNPGIPRSGPSPYSGQATSPPPTQAAPPPSARSAAPTPSRTPQAAPAPSSSPATRSSAPATRSSAPSQVCDLLHVCYLGAP